MILSILRHGQAHHDSHTRLDRDRKLTELGHRQAHAAGVFLGGQKSARWRVIASPFVRAQETGLEVCSVLDQALLTDARLGADHGLGEMVATIEDHLDQEHLVIVSHMPTVGMLETLVTHGPGASGNSYATGQIVVVRVDPQNLIGSGEVLERYRLEDSVLPDASF